MPKKTEEKFYIVPELEVRISESWVRLVRWCQTSFRDGELRIKVINAQPTDLLDMKRKIRFDIEETVPIDSNIDSLAT